MADELRNLGLGVRLVEGGVEFDGAAEDLWRANLWCRVAGRILLRVGTFEATTFRSLDRGLRALEWARWLSRGGPVRVKVAKRKTPLFHTGKVAETALEALGAQFGTRAALGDEPACGVYLRLDGPLVTASLDSSGEHLHRRGYRAATGEAPLRETLAAALLRRTGWDGTEPLLDPFCGSGTFPVEAALLALRIPPGRARRFAFQAFGDFDEAAWRTLLDRAEQGVLPRLPAPVFGADRDPDAVGLAARAARRAGVSDHVQVAVAELEELEAPAPRGVVVANPPYGVRLAGASQALQVLGGALSGAFRGWRWGAALPAADRAAERTLARPVSSRRTFRNGGLRLVWAQGAARIDEEGASW